MLTRLLNLNPILIAMMLVLGVTSVRGQSTAFTYQGKIANSGNPGTATYDMQFKLFDALTNGNPIGATLTNPTVAVTNGLFAVELDFAGGAFDGTPRFLEICVRPAGNQDPYTVLAPRQAITATPYAMRSAAAGTSDGLSVACVSCVTSSQIQSVDGAKITGTVAGSQISGAIPIESVPTGSDNYIRNSAVSALAGEGAAQQTGGFNIEGDGVVGGTLSANVVDSASQFKLAGNRILSNPGDSNLFVGVQAGGVGSTGSNNSFFGRTAGVSATGTYNSVFGAFAGGGGITGNFNALFGALAGGLNSTGSANAFFGHSAGLFNTMGSNNAFFGRQAGDSNTLGTNNTTIGTSADVGMNNLDHATAIGADVIVTASNTVQIGRIGIDMVAIGAFAPSSPPTQVCVNNIGVFINCSSSLRYKTDVRPFHGGLSLIRRLHPISFTWKEGGLQDIGLGAEEVAEVDEQFTFRNPKGQIEGVKYSQLSVLFVNAFKEQQAQIEKQQTQIRERELQAASQQTQLEQYRKQLATQQTQITEQGATLAQQQRQIDALAQLLCQAQWKAEVCQAPRRKQ